MHFWHFCLNLNWHASMVQLVRYGIVGVLNNGLVYLLFLWLTHQGLEPKITMTCLYALGTVMSYIGNWRWTFASQGRFIRTSVRFLLAYAAGYGINLMLLLLLVDHCGYCVQWVQALSIAVVAVFLFIASKCVIFTK